MHFGQGWGEVENGVLRVVTKAAGMYVCIVYGDRCDPDAMADYNSHGGDSMQYEFEFEKAYNLKTLNVSYNSLSPEEIKFLISKVDSTKKIIIEVSSF